MSGLSWFTANDLIFFWTKSIHTGNHEKLIKTWKKNSCRMTKFLRQIYKTVFVYNVNSISWLIFLFGFTPHVAVSQTDRNNLVVLTLLPRSTLLDLEIQAGNPDVESSPFHEDVVTTLRLRNLTDTGITIITSEYGVSWSFFSPPVQIAWWAHMWDMLCMFYIQIWRWALCQRQVAFFINLRILYGGRQCIAFHLLACLSGLI